MDGGKILCSMYRTTLLCVEHAFEDAKQLQVISGSSVASPEAWTTIESAQEMTVFPLIYQAFLKEADAQVISNVSGGNGYIAQFAETFTISCQDASMVLRCNSPQSRDPLFDENEVKKCFHPLLEKLPEYTHGVSMCKNSKAKAALPLTCVLFLDV